jgi:uncharacterized protein (DUF58 family)
VTKQERSRFFEPAKLAGLEAMQFTASRRVEGAYSGRHVAKRRGGAGEFVDYREYAPGDDLRRLDWKAMGRTGRSYLKLFQDETDLRCTLLLDASGSMVQGRQSAKDLRGSKLEWMQYFATALSHLILLGRDAVGLCVVNQRVIEYIPAVASPLHRDRIHQSVASLTPGGTTDLGHGLDELWLQAGRRGVLLVMSDFLVPRLESVLSSIRRFRSRGWEVIALHLIHPTEEKLPDGTAFRFVGLEHDGTVDCQLMDVHQAYRQRFEEHVGVVRNSLVSTGCDYHRIRTSESYLTVLRSFLVMRSS